MDNKVDRVLSAFFYLYSLRLDKPIFIISAPRSGSSYLYETFKFIHRIYYFEKENDPMWWRFFPYSRCVSPNDYIKQEEVDEYKARKIKAYLFAELMKATKEKWELILDGVLLRQPIRYVEKTVANCFHLEALDELFPDALFIHLVRDGRACISSMLEGWNSGFFWERPLSFSANASISHWTYPIPPNWQSVQTMSLEEICAWSWIEHNRYILERCNIYPSFRKRYIRVTYEKLIEEPIETLSTLVRFVDLELSPESVDHLKQQNLSWTTISAPKLDKWKEVNFNRISNILPAISPYMQELGYSL